MKEIFVRTQFVGFHKWDNAPEEVSFLRSRHRHIFHVVAWIKVSHNDRDVEFFMAKGELDRIISQAINKEDTGSCETIAETIGGAYEIVSKVEVSEDNENGAVWTRE